MFTNYILGTNWTQAHILISISQRLEVKLYIHDGKPETTNIKYMALF